MPKKITQKALDNIVIALIDSYKAIKLSPVLRELNTARNFANDQIEFGHSDAEYTTYTNLGNVLGSIEIKYDSGIHETIRASEPLLKESTVISDAISEGLQRVDEQRQKISEQETILSTSKAALRQAVSSHNYETVHQEFDFLNQQDYLTITAKADPNSIIDALQSFNSMFGKFSFSERSIFGTAIKNNEKAINSAKAVLGSESSFDQYKGKLSADSLAGVVYYSNPANAPIPLVSNAEKARKSRVPGWLKATGAFLAGAGLVGLAWLYSSNTTPEPKQLPPHEPTPIHKPVQLPEPNYEKAFKKGDNLWNLTKEAMADLKYSDLGDSAVVASIKKVQEANNIDVKAKDIGFTTSQGYKPYPEGLAESKKDGLADKFSPGETIDFSVLAGKKQTKKSEETKNEHPYTKPEKNAIRQTVAEIGGSNDWYQKLFSEKYVPSYQEQWGNSDDIEFGDMTHDIASIVDNYNRTGTLTTSQKWIDGKQDIVDILNHERLNSNSKSPALTRFSQQLATQEDIDTLINLYNDNSLSVSQVTEEFTAQRGMSISKSTLYSLLNKYDVQKRISAKNPAMRVAA